MNLPPLDKQPKTYCVMTTVKNFSWYQNDKGEQVWRRFSNSYGYDYTIRGFAINRAKDMMQWHKGNGAHSVVINNETQQVEWDSVMGLLV